MSINALNYMGMVRPSTRLKAAEILNYIEKKGFNLTHVWGYDPDPGNPEHHSGTALDFMVFSNKAEGDALVNYIWANRARLGVKHIIWQQRIISTEVMAGKWRNMSDRGSPTNNHRDHVHVWFKDTAYALPTPVKKVVAAVKKVVLPVTRRPTVATLSIGARGPLVANLQRGLNKAFPAYSHLFIDGIFGNSTRVTLMEFQRRSRLTPDGIVGPKTKAALAVYDIKL